MELETLIGISAFLVLTFSFLMKDINFNNGEGRRKGLLFFMIIGFPTWISLSGVIGRLLSNNSLGLIVGMSVILIATVFSVKFKEKLKYLRLSSD